MPTSNDIRQFAHCCVQCAQTVRTEEDRELLLKMAGTWIDVAIFAKQADDPSRPLVTEPSC